MTENVEEPLIESSLVTDVNNLTDREILIKFMGKQDEINKEIIENQQKLLEGLQLSQNGQNGRKRGLEDNNDSIKNPAKRIDSTIPSENASSLTASEMQKKILEKTGKWFVMKHTFKNVSKLGENTKVHSEEQEYFGIVWKMCIHRNKEHLAFDTYCANKAAKGEWSIETDCEVKLLSKDGNPDIRKSCDVYNGKENQEMRNFIGWGWKEYMKWDGVEKDYLIDDSLTFEVSFKIKNTTGIYKNNLKSFDDPECSDIVLAVQDKKIHVSKLYLASHSPYFKAMFLGMFGESKKTEIPLTGVDADDFQNFLEALYGYNVIDEYTVEGLLMVADMYDTPIIIQKCEEFLMKESKKTLKKKLEMSIRYNLVELKKKCLSEIKTIADIRRVVPGDIKDLDASLMVELFEKSLAFN